MQYSPIERTEPVHLLSAFCDSKNKTKDRDSKKNGLRHNILCYCRLPRDTDNTKGITISKA